MLFLFYLLLLLLDNQSVLLPPEDEFDEYVARLSSVFSWLVLGVYLFVVGQGGKFPPILLLR